MSSATWTPDSIVSEAMSNEDRAEFFHHWAVTLHEDRNNRRVPLKQLARIAGFRLQSLKRLDSPKLKDLLATHWQRPGLLQFLSPALRRFHMDKRGELMGFCLDEWRIRHKRGQIEGEHSPPDQAAALRVLDSACERFPRSQVVTYFATNGYLMEAPAWRESLWSALGAARSGEVSPDSTSPTRIPASRTQDGESPEPSARVSRTAAAAPAKRGTDSGPADTDEGDRVEAEGLVTLDDMLIAAAVRAVGDEVGALPVERVDDAIDELIHTNTQRYQSYFHRGFFDGLMGRELNLSGPEMNDPRRAWGLAGFVLALTRRDEPDRVVREVENNKGVLSALGPRSEAEAALLLPHVITAYHANAHYVELCNVLSKEAVAAGGPKPFRQLLELVRLLYRKRKVHEASAVLTLLRLAADSRETPESILAELDRREAQLHKAHGNFDEACQRFERILARTDKAMRSSVLADMGLAKGRFKWLVKVRIPKDPKHSPEIVRRIESGREHYDDALTDLTAGDANAPFILGTYWLLKGLSEKADSGRVYDDDAISHAVEKLGLAYTNAIERVEVYRESEIYGRLCFTYACSLLLSWDEAQYDNATDMLESCAEDFPASKWPEWLLEDAISHALQFETVTLKRLIEKLLKIDEGIVSRYLRNNLGNLSTAILGASPFCLEKVHALASDTRKTWKSRWEAAFALARYWLSSTDSARWSRDNHGEALELMLEAPRHSQDLVKPTVHAITVDAVGKGVWEDGDRLQVLASLASLVGDQDAALGHLLSACTHHRNRGDLERARDVLVQMQEIDGDHAHTHDAQSILPDLVEDAAQERQWPELPSPVKILFVGGNETQIRYEDDLRRDLVEAGVPIELDFKYSGWTSNWGSILDDIKGRLHEYDGVVIMQLIRTNFGRRLNQEISRVNSAGNRSRQIRWRRCTGHGRQSMRLAIENCVRDVLPTGSESGGSGA